MQVKLKTLTPLWTGGVDMKCDRLHETSIIGSLRWWYEVLVRGLGGWACDPTATTGCPDDQGQRCAACELFGCTSWQRKFKLQILDGYGNLFAKKPNATEGLAENILLILRFVELTPIAPEEKWLLQRAVWIASEYGAIGGRTPRKPQRNKKVGGDYGLFELLEVTDAANCNKDQVTLWLRRDVLRRVSNPEWPDLRWFFFVSGQCLWREKINALIGLSKDGKSIEANGPVESALRGNRKPAVSNKVFSFETETAQRLWGYAPGAKVRDQTIQRLQELGIDADNIRTGEEVLHGL